MPREQALALWQAYNRQLLALHRQKAFPVLCFDEDEQTLHRKLDEVMSGYGLVPPREDRFFSSELKHHQGAQEPLSAELDATYRALRAIAY